MSALIILQRQPSTPRGTFGQFFRCGHQIAVTAELPWLNNEPDKSCIPAGTYPCIPHNSPEHPNTWEVTCVSGRSGILIHNANYPSQLEGCIAVGNTYMGEPDGEIIGVANSVETLNQLRLTLPRYFTLQVIDAPAQSA